MQPQPRLKEEAALPILRVTLILLLWGLQGEVTLLRPSHFLSNLEEELPIPEPIAS